MYNGGYDSGEDLYQTELDDAAKLPRYRPPPSPPRGTTRLRPRIEINIPTVEPLKIKQHSTVIPRETFPDVFSPIQAQSAEITGILDLYLDELVTEARSRGVISPDLSEYLKSSRTEKEEEEEVVQKTTVDLTAPALPEKNKIRYVSMVRRALRE